METEQLNIRPSKEQLRNIDIFIENGMFKSRQDVLYFALSEFLMKNINIKVSA